MDILVGGSLLLVVLPFMIVVGLLVWLSSSGPMIYRQTRVGLQGRPCTVRKFRTMRVGADRELERLRHLNDIVQGPLFKMRHDPRVTRVGRWLRRLSLDELPQLLNVVGGSMSLVGPRPALPEEAETYSGLEARRLEVKPGLTGLWQVSGRSDLPWEEGVKLDLEYVERGSVAMDLRILLLTIPAVARARGAY